MDQMPMPQPQRIKKRRIFQAAAHNGRKFVAAGMVMQVIANQQATQMRVGFTTTKKLGNAVVRNRIRRRLREICRLVLPKAGLNGYDYVIIGRKGSLERPFDLLLKDLKYLLGQFKKSIKEKADTDTNSMKKGDRKE